MQWLKSHKLNLGNEIFYDNYDSYDNSMTLYDTYDRFSYNYDIFYDIYDM